MPRSDIPEKDISDLGLTTKQVAQKLNYDPKTIERMRKRGDGPPFIKLGGQVFYPYHEYYEWMKSKFSEMRVISSASCR